MLGRTVIAATRRKTGRPRLRCLVTPARLRRSLAVRDAHDVIPSADPNLLSSSSAKIIAVPGTRTIRGLGTEVVFTSDDGMPVAPRPTHSGRPRLRRVPAWHAHASEAVVTRSQRAGEARKLRIQVLVRR
jgi:hypothetical protein